MRMAVKGVISEDAEQLPELRGERARLASELAARPEPRKVVTLKPALIAHYVRSLEALDDASRVGGVLSEDLKNSSASLCGLSLSIRRAGRKAVVQSTAIWQIWLTTRCSVSLFGGGAVVAGEGLEPPTPGL